MNKLATSIHNMFNNNKIIKKDFGNYMLLSLTDNIPATKTKDLKDATNCLLTLIWKEALNYCDIIIWEEDRGGFLSTLVSYETGIPFSLVKRNPSWLDWDLIIKFRNAYTHGNMYLNWIKEWDKVIIIEDLVDSWWTIIALIKLLQSANIEIIDVVCLAVKEEHKWLEKIYKETWFKVKHAVKFNVESWDKSKVTWVNENL